MCIRDRFGSFSPPVREAPSPSTRVLTEPDFGAAYVKTLRLAGGAELGAGLSEAGVDDSCADAARRMPGATRVRRNIFIRDTTLYGGNDAIDDNFLRFALQTHRSDEL